MTGAGAEKLRKKFDRRILRAVKLGDTELRQFGGTEFDAMEYFVNSAH